MINVDEKRIEALEARVEKIDRLVYRLFKRLPPLPGKNYPAGSVKRLGKADQAV